MFSLRLSVFEILISVFVAFLVSVILYYKWCFSYWKRRNIVVLWEPTIPLGNITNPLSENLRPIGLQAIINHGILKKRNCKHGGFFLCVSPKYLVIAPEYIKNVLIKDFEYFSEREFYYNEKHDPLSANLFAISGEKWRMLRTHLSPAFTTGKIKMMFPNILQCSNQMIDAVMENCKSKQIVEAQDISESYTIDVIGLCGFGVSCNSFKDHYAEFKVQGRKAFHMTPFRIFKIFLGFLCPNIARFLGITLFDRQSNNFFINLVKETMEYRESSNVCRQDLIQMLMDLRNQQKLKPEEEAFTVEEIAAQVFIFFAAGYETSSTTLSFCLYELSLNKDIQNKVRDEISTILKVHNGKLTYETVVDMKYLGQVIDETLRKYPPVTYISRRCVKDYIIPDTNITIEKGIEAIIQIMGLHYDPEYYPEPEKFIPERFSNDENRKRLPFTYLPFGDGPRICIGKRFGILQTKIGLAMLLKKFKFSLNEETDVPLKIEPLSFTLMSKSKIYLDIEEVLEIN